MRIDRVLRIHLPLALVVLLTVVLAFAGASTSSAASPAMADENSPPAGEEDGPHRLAVVERHVSSDMVVDWLEEPPAESAGELDGPAAPAGHGGIDDHDGLGGLEGEEHDHGDVHEGAFGGQASDHDGDGFSPAVPGRGFAVFSASSRWLPTGYTIRLAGSDARIEQYRDEFAAAARDASAAAGVPVRVAAGRSGSIDPSRGEITVMLGTGPCGSEAIGCGGPAMTSTELVAGRVWVDPSALGLSSSKRSNLAAHELGHALGLQHYSSDWSDGRQVMYPVNAETSTFRSGDAAGLRFMAGGDDKPAGGLTGSSYAAGHVHVEGHLSSGSRVRITAGSSSKDVAAVDGTFSAAIPAPAGAHRVCATALDAAVGFRRDLGCSRTTAPGSPFGQLDAVSSSFETIRVKGWAIDPQTAAPVEIEVRRNGTRVTTTTADATRPDVATAHPRYGAAHGYDLDIPAVAGVNDVCIRVLGVGGGGDMDLGCRTVAHAVDPVGVFDVTVDEVGATVAGWALDPNTPAPVIVTATVDGTIPPVPGAFRASTERPDVARTHPDHGPSHGFSQRLVLAPGHHDVCLTVTNVGLGEDRSLGCDQVRVDPSTGVGTVLSSAKPAAPGSGLPDVAAVRAVLADPVGSTRPVACARSGLQDVMGNQTNDHGSSSARNCR